MSYAKRIRLDKRTKAKPVIKCELCGEKTTEIKHLRFPAKDSFLKAFEKPIQQIIKNACLKWYSLYAQKSARKNKDIEPELFKG